MGLISLWQLQLHIGVSVYTKGMDWGLGCGSFNMNGASSWGPWLG
jgi:hypothetical protein